MNEIQKPTAEDLARDPQADNIALREALTWAVGFIRCHGWRCEDYIDFYNAVALIAGREVRSSGPLMQAVSQAMVAEHDRDKLLAAIRRHMNYRGDDRCCGDDHELYSVLPEGDTRPERETLVTIENCQHFIQCRQTGREYVSPQRRIEELEAEVAALRARLDPA